MDETELAETITDIIPMTRHEPDLFFHRPKISILVQYFKRPKNIHRLVDGFKNCNKSPHKLELLVNVDNVDEHWEWAHLAYETEGFVVPVFSNNIHETRGYNRLAGMARGDILIIAQDDRVPPTSCQFFQDLIGLFDQWPQLGGVGMNMGRFRWQSPDEDANRQRDARWINEFYFKDKATGQPMQFVLLADFAPFAFRKTAFVELRGLDEGYTEPGQCGHYTDFDVSMRLWSAGYTLLHWYVPESHAFQNDGEEGNSHKGKAAEQCWRKNLRFGDVHFNRKFSHEVIQMVEQEVNETNHRLLIPFDSSKDG